MCSVILTSYCNDWEPTKPPNRLFQISTLKFVGIHFTIIVFWSNHLYKKKNKKKKNLLLFHFLLSDPSHVRTCGPFAGKMSNIRAVRKRQQLNNLVAMVTELAKPGYTVVDFCSGTVRALIHQSSYTCIFITAPDLGVHRTAAPLAATWKELVSHIFLSSFKCALFLASGHNLTGNYTHGNTYRKWKRYTANRSILGWKGQH